MRKNLTGIATLLAFMATLGGAIFMAASRAPANAGINAGDWLGLFGSLAAGAMTISAGYLALGVADREKALRDAEKNEGKIRAYTRLADALEWRNRMLSVALISLQEGSYETIENYEQFVKDAFFNAEMFFSRRNYMASNEDLLRYSSILSVDVETTISSIIIKENILAQTIYKIKASIERGGVRQEQFETLRFEVKEAARDAESCLAILRNIDGHILGK